MHQHIMLRTLRLFSRSAPSVRNAFSARTMATTSNTDTANFDRSKLFDVSHVTAIVTGGGTGIGLMITQALVANGAKVYITGRRKDALAKTVDLYNHGPGQIVAWATPAISIPLSIADMCYPAYPAM